MKQPAVLVGVGEMGGVFARGLLRLGHPVFPMIRSMHMQDLAAELPDPEMVLIAVAENDLQPVLRQVPDNWRTRLALLQNELLPDDWHGIPEPTVISVWFEKKKSMDAKVIIPSPVFGPKATLLVDALGAIDIPARVLENEDALLFELVVKNLYILTSNIAGLRTGGTVGELWERNREFAHQVASDVIDTQESLTGRRFDRERLVSAMVDAFQADPEHKCMGRSAPARLARALEHAKDLGLALPTLEHLQQESN